MNKNYFNEENRIYNQIYNGAKSYNFKPPLVGFNLSGNPDFYTNLIIGLSIKYFGKDTIVKLFSLRENNKNRDRFDLFAIYLLEDICYKREYQNRPHIKTLRYDYAREFLADKNDLRRRNLALKENLYYSLIMKKCSDILGIKYKLSEKENQIYNNFSLDSSTNPMNLSCKILYLFKKYLNFSEKKKYISPLNISFSLFNIKGVYQLERSNRADIFKNKNASTNNFIEKFVANRRNSKREEIIKTFGIPLFSLEKELLINEICAVDKHKKSHVYFTKGETKNSYDIINSLNQKARERNYTYYKENENKNKRIINRLAKNIKLSLNSINDSDTYTAKEGMLVGSLAWKAKVGNNPKIFSKKTYDDKDTFRVTILLDGSNSLLYKQEIVASEAYILSMALSKNNINHRIISYSTVNDYTALTFLKAFDEKTDVNRIFSYKTIGFNRDGLAMRAISSITDKSTKNELLLILTDASPSDIKPLITEGFSLNKPYKGQAALTDYKEEINQLRKKNIKIAALIHKDNPENAAYLFYKDFVRINDLNNLANAGARLIKNQIKKLNK
ncbi:hypothetical protein [Anaerococcus prevotii]|uniref:Conserved domain protein n=1 Tax=Anaerococcus prevotii ACS-065-V-Col13 TaxID=879305 RepID=F0GV13_9FIRM|nr:hypothetical protein [Anaerococcus prevotii]EGC82532.1 conserved domain protein [Anaerococcus prevotii ACS-065-V-Col13]